MTLEALVAASVPVVQLAWLIARIEALHRRVARIEDDEKRVLAEVRVLEARVVALEAR